MKSRLLSLLVIAVMILGVLPIVSGVADTTDPYVDDPFDDKPTTSSQGGTTTVTKAPSVTTTTAPKTTEKKSIGKKISGLKLRMTSVNSLKLTWNQTENAEYYNVYRTDGSKAIGFYKKVTSNSFVDKSLKRGKTYSYQIKAFSKTLNQSSDFSSKVKADIFPDKISSVSAKVKATSIALTVKKVKGAQKYEVVYSTNKNFKNKKTKTSKSNKITVKKLKKNTKYFFKIRAVKKVANKNYYTKYFKLNKKTKK